MRKCRAHAINRKAVEAFVVVLVFVVDLILFLL